MRKSGVLSLWFFLCMVYPDIMIKNKEKIIAFEDNLIKNRPIDIKQNFIVFEILKNQEIQMNRWVTNDLEGIESKMKLARALNGRR